MATTTQKFFALLCELRKLYKIEIVADEKLHDPFINFELPSREESTAFLEFLRDELAHYSAATIERMQLDRILLCTQLAKLDQSISGCASMSLFPDSLPLRMLFRKNTIYLATEYCNKIEGRISIHHELFHAIEAHDKSWPKYCDPHWPSFNPPAFRYQDDVGFTESENYPLNCDGFLTSYSMQSVREDKAELFAHMIVNYARVKQFAAETTNASAPKSRA